MNNRSQSLLMQFSNQQLQQPRRAQTLGEKEQLMIRFKQELGQDSEIAVEVDQTKDLVSQLVKTVQAIDWACIQDDPESMDLLSSVELRLDHKAELVDQWKYAPVTITSRYEQLEMELGPYA